ncbi:hypothetical protein Malapachy_0954 [Malassezia pachydermatis]|uniref:Uncharacterized protein n=1 Tax=Malassezia pachydermatis TaxID=77020 RepID=A0A0M8MQS5_9BASI|nr:hypothetical protein Malapachy_0954 [Malassezia pachydermatis]KOS14957.1 hypothetical protein Malapachy_0954 [Malassezia pachydermatis]
MLRGGRQSPRITPYTLARPMTGYSQTFSSERSGNEVPSETNVPFAVNIAPFSMTDTTPESVKSNTTAETLTGQMAELNWHPQATASHMDVQTQNIGPPSADAWSMPVGMDVIPAAPGLPAFLLSTDAPGTSMPTSLRAAPPSLLSPLTDPLASSNVTTIPSTESMLSSDSQQSNELAHSLLELPFSMGIEGEKIPKRNLSSLPPINTDDFSAEEYQWFASAPSASHMALFSPGHSILATGSNHVQSWLDDTLVPSPMYERGANTGWSGLLGSVDENRTPTYASYMNAQKGWPPTTNRATAPAVLTTSHDWWSYNEEAQERFHKYILNVLPLHGFFQNNDRRTTLAVAVISKFLTYATFMYLRDPHAPQPPFLHRAMLLQYREDIPEHLCIARASLAALSMRLPHSEVWAWKLVGQEFAKLVTKAQETAVKSYNYRNSLDGTVYEAILMQSLTFEKLWEQVSMAQALWLYLVVGSFGNWLESHGNDLQQWSTEHEFWGPMLTPLAVEALQAYLNELAVTAYLLQSNGWAKPANFVCKNQQDTNFMWWGLCETLRRTILSAHALLVLLRFCRYAHDHSVAVATLGHAPCRSDISQAQWKPIMELEMPSIATVFEAQDYSHWRQCLANEMEEGRGPSMTLSFCMQQRGHAQTAAKSNERDAVERYLHRHDEFTNVCLSALYGLTSS